MTTSSDGSPDMFPSKFVEIYKANKKDLCGLLVAGISKEVIARIDGYKKQPMSIKVFNVFRVQEASNQKYVYLVSANLTGPWINSI